MADRKPARLAAPLALLAAAVAIVVVVQSSRSSSSSDSPSTTHTAVTQPARHARTAPRVYVVKPGDTLSVIAAQAKVSLETIQRLNPSVDPNALQTGQRIKLSP